MKRKVLLGLMLILFLCLLQACDSAQAPIDSASIPDQVGNVQWVTPLIPSPTPVMVYIGTLQVFRYPYSIDHLEEIPGPYIDIGDWLLATPTTPSFVINDSKLFDCNGTVYMVIQVTNNGPYYFQDISLGISHGTEWVGVGFDDDPYIFNDSQCPVTPPPHWPSLWPGGTAYIYQEVHPDPAYTEYNIHLTMCTFTDIPDPCMYRYRLHTEAWPTPTPTLWTFIRPYYIHVIRTDLCRLGNTEKFEVVNTEKEGTELELLGIGEDDRFFIVNDPQYNRPCWFDRESLDPVPDEIIPLLEVYRIPLLPTDTPTPVPRDGQVKGRVFLDNDKSGSFTNGDVPAAGIQIGLAPGSCSNPGQAIATTTTNNNGRFTFSGVPSGNYCVAAALPRNCKTWITPGRYAFTLPGGGVVETEFGCQ